MRAVDIIIKKRDRQELNKEEIDFFVQGFTRGDIPDYQVSSWAMAVMLNGMSDREATDLTLAMAGSGDVIDLSQVVPIAVDKHSTGGVGDKVTIVVAPLVAACGLPVGKMSGRGLGFSGGTLDKLESIPGYRTDLSEAEFKEQLRTLGIVLTGQSGELAPADGKLYALRDVTGTVPSIPLIASSVMSKKFAAGAQAIVLDVKVGVGAFMETLEDARHLAHLMVSIGKMSGRQVVALVSDMNQPLGEAVGNALELIEAIETLRGQGPADLREHCLVVASHMLVLGRKATEIPKARKMAENALNDASAFNTFCSLVEAQGGDSTYVKEPGKFPQARYIETLGSNDEGYLRALSARDIGEITVSLGAGRARKDDKIDHSVGVRVHRKVGDWVKKGDPLFTVHANDREKLEIAKQLLPRALQWSITPAEPLPLFYEIIQ